MKKCILAVSLLLSTFAFASEKIGSVETSGLLFKDSINIISFDDPSVKGVTCYVTLPDRSFSFDDPSDSSISCKRMTANVSGNYKQRTNDLFSKSKSLFFKAMRVDRFYDSKNNALVYISYTRKVSGENHSHSISVVPLNNID